MRTRWHVSISDNYKERSAKDTYQIGTEEYPCLGDQIKLGVTVQKYPVGSQEFGSVFRLGPEFKCGTLTRQRWHGTLWWVFSEEEVIDTVLVLFGMGNLSIRNFFFFQSLYRLVYVFQTYKMKSSPHLWDHTRTYLRIVRRFGSRDLWKKRLVDTCPQDLVRDPLYHETSNTVWGPDTGI